MKNVTPEESSRRSSTLCARTFWLRMTISSKLTDNGNHTQTCDGFQDAVPVVVSSRSSCCINELSAITTKVTTEENDIATLSEVNWSFCDQGPRNEPRITYITSFILCQWCVKIEVNTWQIYAKTKLGSLRRNSPPMNSLVHATIWHFVS